MILEGLTAESGRKLNGQRGTVVGHRDDRVEVLLEEPRTVSVRSVNVTPRRDATRDQQDRYARMFMYPPNLAKHAREIMDICGPYGVRELLTRGVGAQQVLDAACCSPGLEVATAMALAKGANPEVANDDWPPLHRAAKNGALGSLALMLRGRRVHARTKVTGTSLICAAAEAGLLPVVRYLLDHGADPNDTKGSNGSPALFLALQGGSLDVAFELISRGADVNKCCADGGHPIGMAMKSGPGGAALMVRHGSLIIPDDKAHEDLAKFAHTCQDRNLLKEKDVTSIVTACHNGRFDMALEACEESTYSLRVAYLRLRCLEMIRGKDPALVLGALAEFLGTHGNYRGDAIGEAMVAIIKADEPRVRARCYGAPGSDAHVVCARRLPPVEGEVTPPECRSASAIFYDDVVYRFGGQGIATLAKKIVSSNNETWAFSTGPEVWHRVDTTGPAPSPRYSHSACVFKGVMYVWGGQCFGRSQ